MRPERKKHWPRLWSNFKQQETSFSNWNISNGVDNMDHQSLSHIINWFLLCSLKCDISCQLWLRECFRVFCFFFSPPPTAKNIKGALQSNWSLLNELKFIWQAEERFPSLTPFLTFGNGWHETLLPPRSVAIRLLIVTVFPILNLWI